MRQWYEILGVDADTDQSSIKQAYRKLALEWHPDKNNSDEAKEKFQEISAAFQFAMDVNNKNKNFPDPYKDGAYVNAYALSEFEKETFKKLLNEIILKISPHKEKVRITFDSYGLVIRNNDNDFSSLTIGETKEILTLLKYIVDKSLSVNAASGSIAQDFIGDMIKLYDTSTIQFVEHKIFLNADVNDSPYPYFTIKNEILRYYFPAFLDNKYIIDEALADYGTINDWKTYLNTRDCSSSKAYIEFSDSSLNLCIDGDNKSHESIAQLLTSIGIENPSQYQVDRRYTIPFVSLKNLDSSHLVDDLQIYRCINNLHCLIEANDWIAFKIHLKKIDERHKGYIPAKDYIYILNHLMIYENLKNPARVEALTNYSNILLSLSSDNLKPILRLLYESKYEKSVGSKDAKDYLSAFIVKKTSFDTFEYIYRVLADIYDERGILYNPNDLLKERLVRALSPKRFNELPTLLTKLNIGNDEVLKPFQKYVDENECLELYEVVKHLDNILKEPCYLRYKLILFCNAIEKGTFEDIKLINQIFKLKLKLREKEIYSIGHAFAERFANFFRKYDKNITLETFPIQYHIIQIDVNKSFHDTLEGEKLEEFNNLVNIAKYLFSEHKDQSIPQNIINKCFKNHKNRKAQFKDFYEHFVNNNAIGTSSPTDNKLSSFTNTLLDNPIKSILCATALCAVALYSLKINPIINAAASITLGATGYAAISYTKSNNAGKGA